MFLGSAALRLAALELHRERASPTDLALIGKLAGVPAGETRYVRWAELRALPTTTLALAVDFAAGKRQVTALFLADLWAELPRTAGADVVFAMCKDGYASVYRDTFMAECRPFLILEIEGAGPEKWPPPGLTFDAAPYMITVSAEVAPAVAKLLDAGHKRPWGVTTIEVASYAEKFAGIYSGRWAALSPRAVAGREIWINSCASCHVGPAAVFGGTKSDRPFELLAAHAANNPAFFNDYVRTPKRVIPTSKMDGHPHYTDAHLADLIAFITAESAPASPGSARIEMREQLVASVRHVLACWEAGDSAGFLAAFADDAVFAYPGGRVGKSDLGALFADLQSRKRDVKVYVGPFVVAGNEFALRYQFACTDRVTGRRQAVGTGVRGTLRNGKIVKFKEYWDAHIAPEQAEGKLPLDEGDPLFPIAAGFMMTPERVN